MGTQLIADKAGRLGNERAGGVAEATSREFTSGQKVFDRYTLIKVLGRGGMGIVWLARDEELERDVALKFLPDLMIHDRAVLDQLKREAKRCLELTHPHIVRIYDFVHDERMACISMEYVDGETLSNLRAEREQKVFEPNELAPLTAQLCEALDYAHNDARVIHRDLKPANLMVNRRGELKVSDLGIARSLSDTVSRLTMEQGRSGTLVYMSPQQLDGKRATHLDDIYSLGATLYDLLTSKPPFYSGDIARQIHERVPPSMTERRKDLNIEPASVPPIWEEVVAACLDKDPAKRPQSAMEVARRLQLSAAPISTVAGIADAGRDRRSRLQYFLWIGAAVLICLIGLGGWYLTKSRAHTRAAAGAMSPLTQPAAITEKSIAVLPFENLSEENANAFFADGVQDEILNDLARIADLKVISRTSVMRYKTGITRNLREIGQQLGVAHVVEGTVQRSGNRVRVNAQLIDARSDKHVWGQIYDRDLSDVFAIQSEIAKTIADQLQAKLSPSEKASIEEQPTKDLVAYDLYVRATPLIEAFYSSSNYEKDLLQAVELLNQAIARDPGFLLAYCRLAEAHDELYFFGVDRTSNRLALAKTAIDSAFRIKPDSGEAHLALARHLYHGYFDYDQARDELAIAVRTLPNNARIFEWSGIVDRRQNRWHNAVRNLERAMELDPRNVKILTTAAVTYALLRDYKQARETIDRVIAINPNAINAKLFRAGIDFKERADVRPLHAEMERALPEFPALRAANMFFLALLERDAVAADRALAVLAVSPEVKSLNYFFPARGIGETTFSLTYAKGLIAQMKGDAAAAQAAFTVARVQQEEAVRAEPDHGPVLCVLGLIDAGLGRKEDALREGRGALELAPIAKDSLNGADVLYFYAVICAWTGEHDLAIEQLQTLAKLPAGASYGDLRLNPRWEPLRGDPRFEKLLEEAKQPVELK